MKKDSPAKDDQVLQAQEISYEEFCKMTVAEGALIIDARPEGFYARGHIPGAISLARETFAASYTEQQLMLERYRHSPVLLYCRGSSCEESHLVAGALQRLGYRQLYIFTGGWSEWQERLETEKK